MRADAFVCALVASLAPALPVEDPRASEDARARAAFALLTAAERREVIDFLETEVGHLGAFQDGLARWLEARQERDPALWPEEAEAPCFDPEVHAPAQPIPRRRLAPKDARALAARKALGVRDDPRAWRYDWGGGGILRRAQVDLAQRAFDLALAGEHPRLDLAVALVEAALDDGSARAAHAAFAHAYTDRAGLVFPGVTLYDAWASGREIEMPDVDCLGIVHAVLGDWTTWRSVVPATQHEALYARIGELYAGARAQRELRAALARTFLAAAPGADAWDGAPWQGTLDNLHALWDECASTPETLRARLPAAARWKEFVAAWVDECHARPEAFQRGVARRAVLARDGAAVRATLLRVLDEYGAFARPGAAPEQHPRKDR